MRFDPLIILSCLGLALSIYAFRVKKNLDRYSGYKPICDISNRVNCTRALTSKEGSLFIIPNSLWGMFYYLFLIFFVEYGWLSWAFALSTAGLIVSLYLAYILYFKQKNFCVVCWATHLTNAFLFVLALRAALLGGVL